MTAAGFCDQISWAAMAAEMSIKVNALDAVHQKNRFSRKHLLSHFESNSARRTRQEIDSLSV
jgi:hypothetical protein